MKKYIYIACALFLAVASFLIGRATVNTEAKIEFIQGEEVTGSVSASKLKPDTVYIPIPGKPILVPTKPDTIRLPGEIIVVQVPDTVAVFNDYISRKDYSLNLFDDAERGKADVFLSLQYNALQSLDWKFTPVRKVETRTRKRVFEPFVSAGYSTLDYVSAGGGVFYHHVGIEYQYQKSFKPPDDGHYISVKWKF